MIASLVQPVTYDREPVQLLILGAASLVALTFLGLCLFAILSGFVESWRRRRRHGLNRKARHIGRKP